MDLTIDIGNSYHKAAVFSEKGEMVSFKSYKTLKIKHLDDFFKFFPVKRSILSSVGKKSPGLEEYLKEKTQYFCFSKTSKLPISLQYETPGTLGLDRIANAVAANDLFPGKNILSIQAGSCLVFDFINKEGEYLGGAISPGIEMRFKALHRFTGQLPLLTKKEIDCFIGRSTQQSIESGVINGIIHEINGSIGHYASEYQELKIVISGGDAEYLQKSIKNSTFAGSDFILRGLHKILKFNV